MAEDLVERIAGEGSPDLQALVRERLARLRAELSGAAPTPLEALLVDRIAVCWLDLARLDAMWSRGPRARPPPSRCSGSTAGPTSDSCRR